MRRRYSAAGCSSSAAPSATRNRRLGRGDTARYCPRNWSTAMRTRSATLFRTGQKGRCRDSSMAWKRRKSTGLSFCSKALRAAPNGALLTGTVKSASGEKMRGVTVSAKMEGQTITTSVFTDDVGNYYFPALDAGKYQVWAQADTFETARAAVELAATRHQDFSMKPMQDFERQLTGDQFLASLPEDTPEDRRLKRVFRNNCTSCHQPNYILQNRFDADGWIAIMNAMRDFTVTGNYNGEDSAAAPTIEYFKKDLAEYLAKVRGPGPSAMKFNLRSRPRAEAARVVFTEYDVPLDPGGGSDTKYPTNNGSDWSLGTPSSLNGSHGVHDAQADFNGN